MTQKRILTDVAIMRPMVMFMLVVLHSFTTYAGYWPYPEGIQPVRAYSWIALASYSFLLEAFFFMSGYVAAFQESNRTISFTELVRKKFKRLMMPCLVFGTAYALMYRPQTSIGHWIKEIVGGSGHLWFLPTLFIVMIASYFVHRLKIKEWIKVALLLVLSFASFRFTKVTFQVQFACYYMFFYYAGTFIYKHRDTILEWATGGKVWLVALLYVVVFVVGTLHIESIRPDGPATAYMLSRSKLGIINAWRVAYGSLGTMAMWLMINRMWSSITIPKWLSWANSISFGVYIFQNFILWGLFQYTALPAITGTYLMPWVGLLIATIGSVALTAALKQTRIGKQLL